MNLSNLFQALGSLPRLMELVALAKSMPTLMDDANQMLLVIEKALDDAKASSPSLAANLDAAKAAVDSVRATLSTVESGLKNLLGG